VESTAHFKAVLPKLGDNSKKSQGIIKGKFQKVSKNFKRRIEIQPGSVFRAGFWCFESI